MLKTHAATVLYLYVDLSFFQFRNFLPHWRTQVCVNTAKWSVCMRERERERERERDLFYCSNSLSLCKCPDMNLTCNYKQHTYMPFNNLLNIVTMFML